MIRLKKCILLIIIILMFLPIIFLNRDKGAVSNIDNRRLTDNPFEKKIKINDQNIKKFDDYIKDRIGFRSYMIKKYTILNDKMFHEMVHPSYEYGKNGYVFFKYWDSREGQLSDYEIVFAKTIKKMQDYCEAREIPFLFVFNPSKMSVCQDKLANGYNYNREWILNFFDLLDKLNVHYIDNTEILLGKYNAGENVFNIKYNAGHWNDLGAYYGVNKIAQEIKKEYPEIHVNTKNDYHIRAILRHSLMVSEFPIHEYEHQFILKDCDNLKEKPIGNIKIYKQYPYFRHIINQERNSNSPKILCFQGSYMNGNGYKFMENISKEYIAIHDYQNVLNLPYYIKEYSPEYVVFETAEYTLADKYYSYEKMQNINWDH